LYDLDLMILTLDHLDIVKMCLHMKV